MLVIRKEQMEVLSHYVLKGFEDRMVEHLNEFFPDQCETLGEPDVREAVQYGIDRAGSYGITSERDVCKYLNLMFTFGRDFDVDPRLPWAAAILNAGDVTDPTRKIERLYTEAMDNAHEGNGFSAQDSS